MKPPKRMTIKVQCQDDGRWTASEPFTKEWGESDTATAAVAALISTFHDRVESLRKRQDKLAPELLAGLEWLTGEMAKWRTPTTAFHTTASSLVYRALTTASSHSP